MKKEGSITEIKPKLMFAPFVMVFATCFMLFIVEPITMYSANSSDFWFDLGMMMPPLLLAFGVAMVAFMLGFCGLYFIAKVTKHPRIFYSPTLLYFALFIVAYIHGNFLY